MPREHLFARTLPTDPWFRWRGGEVSRVEGLSDAAFAFSLTLLVVSLEVPDTFDAMKTAFRQLPAFAACFAMLIWCWYSHYLFFRRYGLVDALTITLNSALLFVILIYVYPLKFMATWLFGQVTRDPAMPKILVRDVPDLMLLYGGGVVAVFGLFTLMHFRAYRLADALQLDELERGLARASMGDFLVMMSFGLISIALVLTGHVGASGLIYFGVGPAMWFHGVWSRRPLARLAERMERGDPVTPDRPNPE